MVSEPEKVAATQPSGAAQGVPASTGAAQQGVPSQPADTGTPSATETRDQPRLVPEEDLRRLQASLNRQADALRRDVQTRDQVLAQAYQERQTFEQEIETLRKQVLELRTQGLSQEEADAERLKEERDRLARHNQWLAQQAQAAQQELRVQRHALTESEARGDAIKLLLQGGTRPRDGFAFEGFERYGLTRADLESCHDPYQMEAVAFKKRDAFFAKEREDLKREKAALEAQQRKSTGAHTFDRGEPTGGSERPKRGTPEWQEFVNKVKAGQISLRN